jgi:hypothetical protein
MTPSISQSISQSISRLRRAWSTALCLAIAACGPKPVLVPPGGDALDRRVLVRCYVTDWSTPGRFTLAAPAPGKPGPRFSVVAGTRDHLVYAATSAGGPLEVPLDKLTAGGRRLDVFVVLGDASVHDHFAAKDDRSLNVQIARQQATAPAVEVTRGLDPQRFRPVNECLEPVNDDCTTPRCPPH